MSLNWAYRIVLFVVCLVHNYPIPFDDSQMLHSSNYNLVNTPELPEASSPLPLRGVPLGLL